MALRPGTFLGPYEVTAQIGAGGMGEVYRATDTNLNRQVAIKVLPEAFALDAERLARFEREARTLASVNHPNIASVHGLERSNGVALVMELVDGPTLADRIAEGPIPWDEARPIAMQIADALDAAHEQGLVHRDLKPANVKVRPDGTVKVLDFGLAKAVEPVGGALSGVTHSPTITSPAMTAAGVLLGTAAYMSPEQARARAVDKRTDIWAFGAVLYEMLTGRRAFAGEDVSEVLASVLAREPDWSALPDVVPASAVTIIKRCLQKDRKQRVRDIGDVAPALSGAFDVSAPLSPALAVAAPIWRRALPVAAAALLAALTTGLAAWRLAPQGTEPQDVTRFEFVPPEGQRLSLAQRPVLAIAPDGRFLVYESGGELYMRMMGELEARRIDVTGPRGETPVSPMVSPDGQWIAYFTRGQLQKVSTSGGTATTLATAAGALGGTAGALIVTGVALSGSWSFDNTILFSQRDGISRISANGGVPEIVVKASGNEQYYLPQLLPGGRAILYTVTSALGPDRWNQAEIVAQTLATGERTVLVKGGYQATYLPSGHLVYVLRGTVFGVGFDAPRLAVTSAAVPLVQDIGVPVGVAAAGANYAVSQNGSLAYIRGGSPPRRALVWKPRGDGPVVPITSIPPGTHEDPRLSRDGARVLVTQDGDIWTYDLTSGRRTRVTRDGVSVMGVWNPQGTRIAYSSAAAGNLEAWVTSSDGAGDPTKLTTLGGQIHVDSWSPDGRLLTMHRHSSDGPVTIHVVPMEGTDRTPRQFLDGKSAAEGTDFSPDMRFVAYLSVESGQREIYIRPYPGPGGQATVSVGGGREPKWMSNGEVFYRSLNGDRMFAVSAATTPQLTIGPPVELFQGPFYIAPSGSPRPQYDVTPDGQRFLMLTRAADSSTAGPTVVVVQNWLEEVRRLVPVN